MRNKRKTKNEKRETKTKSLRLLVLSFTFLVLSFTFCSAQPISSTELINNARKYDGKIVYFEGEVIGEVMARQDDAWINVSDGHNAIGVWVKKKLIKDIVFAGSYKTIGDGIEVTGFFHRACPEHGGDLDIHAISLRKTGAGRGMREKLNSGKKEQVVILLGVLGLIWILTLSKRR